MTGMIRVKDHVELSLFMGILSNKKWPLAV